MELSIYYKPPRFTLILAIVLALLVLMVACSGSPSPQAEVESDTETEYQVMLPAVESNDDPLAKQAYPEPEVESQGGEASVSDEAYPLPEKPVEAPAPIIRTELSATDPAMVSLASGDIQLIEFFAFW